MKRTIIALFALLLTACGSGYTEEPAAAPVKTQQLTVSSPTPVCGLDFWIYTQDTTPLKFHLNGISAMRYDTTAQGWHVAIVSLQPFNGMPIVNMPQTYRLEIVQAIDGEGMPIQNFDWRF